uniref:Uncharacterized protein n=1 Tax=Timema poppense TaxID=170557 RepID=A0A7R9D9X9_TIMPO|nr:unnamed protein product [Timema poppensis]
MIPDRGCGASHDFASISSTTSLLVGPNGSEGLNSNTTSGFTNEASAIVADHSHRSCDCDINSVSLSCPAGDINSVSLSCPAGDINNVSLFCPAGDINSVQCLALQVILTVYHCLAQSCPEADINSVSLSCHAGDINSVSLSRPAGDINSVSLSCPAGDINRVSLSCPAGDIVIHVLFLRPYLIRQAMLVPAQAGRKCYVHKHARVPGKAEEPLLRC